MNETPQPELKVEPITVLSPLKKQMLDKRIQKKLKREERMKEPYSPQVPYRKDNVRKWDELHHLSNILKQTLNGISEQMDIYENTNLLPDGVKERVESYKATYIKTLGTLIMEYNEIVASMKSGAVDDDDLALFFSNASKIEQCGNKVTLTLIPLYMELQSDLAVI